MKKIENGLEYTEEIMMENSEGFVKKYPSRWQRFKNWIRGKKTWVE